MNTEKWNVLIVDDEEQVHCVTKLVLKEFLFENKEIDLISAYSAKEAKEILEKRDDIAIIFLDVVMEEDHSGLDLIKYIRKTLQNAFIRIVLRTGQPGMAPENEVINNYDINDYRVKTEFTSEKMYTVITSCLRDYKQLISLDAEREKLEKQLETHRGSKIQSITITSGNKKESYTLNIQDKNNTPEVDC